MAKKTLSRSEARAARLQLLQKSLRKEFKSENHMKMAAHIPRPKRLLTGSLRFDALTGGGWVMGKQHMMSGWQGAGKTTMALHTVKAAQRSCSSCHNSITPQLIVPELDIPDEALQKWREQRMACLGCGAPYHSRDRKPMKAGAFFKSQGQAKCPDGISKNDLWCHECDAANLIVPLDEEDEFRRIEEDLSCGCTDMVPMVAMYVDLERKLDLDWARRIGVDLDRLWVEEVEFGEQSADVVREAIVQGVVDIIVFDSIANVSPSDEMDRSASENEKPGERARLINKLVRQIPNLTNQAKTKHGVEPTLIWINQIREKIGVSFGNPETMPGGHGQKFAVTTWINFSSNRTQVETIDGVGRKSKDEHLSVATMNELKCKCSKNGAGATEGLKAVIPLVTANDGVLRAGSVNDFTLTYGYGKATGVIYKEESVKKWRVKDWPLEYSNEGDLKIDLHERWYFKDHVTRLALEVLDDDWGMLKERMGKTASSDGEDEE